MNIPLFKVYMSPTVKEEVEKTLYSGMITQGPKVKEFEAALSEYFNAPNVVAVNSGTSALQLALRLIGVRGKNVISTPMTMAATNWAILAEGARIIWTDVFPNSGLIKPSSVAEIVEKNDNIAAIMAVDWAGYPADIDRLNKYNIPVIEDAAQAFGALYLGAKIGYGSHYLCLSFQAIKHVTCGDGGALIINSKYPDNYKRAKLLRFYGIDREAPKLDFRCENDIPEAGLKWNMNDIDATIGIENLKKIEERLAINRHNAAYYDAELSKIPGIALCKKTDNSVPSYWVYQFLAQDQQKLITKLNMAGIQASRLHERNDMHSCVSKYRSPYLPGVNQFANQVVCIPCGFWVTPENTEYIVSVIRSGW